ncbi:MAG: hypothetical protein CMP74_02720 [Flavobacteriales bacterium]|nr:hypothetical protein [Flavobacteriales bacterium]|tara:strand:+ start:1918 stop:3267 length:1350 start_codon:yes stop_codon:yes gene_type:complete
MIKNILALFILNLIFVYSQNENKQLLDGVVAVVGDQVVFLSDLQESISQYEAQFNELQSDQVISEVLEELLFQKLLLHHASIDSLVVGENEVQNNLNRRIEYLVTTLGSERKVEQYFDKSFSKIKETLLNSVRDQMTVQLMQQEITAFTEVTPSDVNYFFNNLNKDSLPYLDEQFKIGQILILPNPSDSSLIQTKEKLNNLRNRILTGDKFSTMAILYSEDPGSSRNGGEYVNIKKGQLTKQFEAVIYSLSPGEISNVFETEYGFHIAELTNRTGGIVDFRHILMIPKIFQHQMEETKTFLTSLKDIIENGESTFEKAAKDFSNDDETKYNGGLLINPQTGEHSFFIDELDPLLKNKLKDLEEGSIIGPLYYKLPDGKESYRLVKLIQKTEPHFANINQDYNLIKMYAENEKKQKKLSNWINSKIENTYIYLNSDFLNNDFVYNWKKNN